MKHWRWRIRFMVGKHMKEMDKISVSQADAFWKVQVDFRRAAKPPVFVSAAQLEL